MLFPINNSKTPFFIIIQFRLKSYSLKKESSNSNTSSGVLRKFTFLANSLRKNPADFFRAVVYKNYCFYRLSEYIIEEQIYKLHLKYSKY